jgi:hypothetical protein
MVRQKNNQKQQTNQKQKNGIRKEQTFSITKQWFRIEIVLQNIL